MPVISLRIDDQLHLDLTSTAKAQGVSVSDLARGALATILNLDPTAPRETASGRAAVPESMTTAERQQLALLNRILAAVIDEGDEAGDPESLTERAIILERGYTERYDDVFVTIEPELSRRDTGFVMDVLEMFEHLEASYDALTEDERSRLDEFADLQVRFRGFDFNNRREHRLANYAEHLIDEGRWESLAKYFERERGRGNSHKLMTATYEAMLAEFEPIWRRKVRGPLVGGPDRYRLSADEINCILGYGGFDPEIWSAS